MSDLPQFRLRLWLLAGAFLLLAGIALLVDFPVARFCETAYLPRDIRQIISLSEICAHGTGIVLILIAIVTLDPQGRRQLPLVATCAYGAGAFAYLGKTLIVRTRPGISDLTTSPEATFLGFRPYVDIVLKPSEGMNVYQSFPSGHEATAVGLMVALTLVYPRGRKLFAVMAVMAAVQRVFEGHHFVSDTLAGASVAFAWCALISPWILSRLAPAEPVSELQTPLKLRSAA